MRRIFLTGLLVVLGFSLCVKSGAQVILENSTVHDNEGTTSVGGILVIGTDAGTTNALVLINTVVAGNTGDNPDCALVNATASLEGVNLLGNNDASNSIQEVSGTPQPCATPTSGQMIGTSSSPIAADLGGRETGSSTDTPFHPPLFGGNLVDAAELALCPAEDQNGTSRSGGFGCDIGAIELAVASVTTEGTGNGLGTMTGSSGVPNRGTNQTNDTIDCDYDGQGSETGDCQANFFPEDGYSITATAMAGSRFVEWTQCPQTTGASGEVCVIPAETQSVTRGDCRGTGCDSDYVVIAEFRAQGQLIISKEPIADAPEGLTFDFTVEDNPQLDDFSLTPGQQLSVILDAPFSALITEDDPASQGFKLTSVDCSESPAGRGGSPSQPGPTGVNVALDPFEVVDCTFTNRPLEVALVVEKTANTDEVSLGEDITFQIVVRNDGPDQALGVNVLDDFSDAFSAVMWSCMGLDGGVCGNAEGTGDIDELVDLPVGASVVFTATATPAGDFSGEVTNTASAAAAENVVEVFVDDNVDSAQGVQVGTVTEIPTNTTWGLILFAMGVAWLAVRRLQL